MTDSGALLVGRERPWRVLVDAVEHSTRGSGGLVLVTGEAGIGKTAMVASTLDFARGAGALVGVGGCWDGEGAPGYWPWVQIMRTLRRDAPASVWDRGRDEAGAGLDRLLGEHAVLPGEDGGTFAVLDAVTTLLQIVAHDRPLVLAIEDLHWADQASLRLLGVVARQARLCPILLLGTYRDDEVLVATHPRRMDLLELAAQANTIPLAGLDPAAVSILLARHGVDSADDIARDVQRRTGGNPFFVQQLAHLWQTSGSTSPIPSGVEVAIERRLARLPSPVAELLVTASVLGTRFDPRLLTTVAGIEPTAGAALLDQARAAGLVRVDPTGEHRFVHDVVREALHDSLDTDERRHRHAAAARALAIAPDLADTRAVVQIAHHAALAVPEIPALEAADLSRVAAEDAAGRSAHDEAVAHLGRTLDLLPNPHPDRRELVAMLATEQRRAGLLDQARATFTRLADEADADDDNATFALAALGLHGLGDTIGVGTSSDDFEDDVAVRLISAGHRLDADSTLEPSTRERLAARLLAAMARTTAHRVGDDDRAAPIELSSQAVDRARRSGDDATLAFCLLALHDSIWAPGTAAERLAVTEEMAAVARRCGDHELELQAVLLQFVALLEQGDPRSLTVLEGFLDLEARLELPRWRYVALSRRATLATLQGRFEAASRWIAETSTLGERLGEVDRHGVRCDQIWEVARLQGDDNTTAALIATYHDDPHILVLQFGDAYDRGDLAGADRLRVAFEELGARWPRWAATVWLSLEVQLAVAAGDRDRCTRLRTEVAPIADQWAVLGGGVMTRGPMILWRAALDAALDMWDDAIDGFIAAVASAEALGARPWVVQARLGLAQSLLARAGPGDTTTATALLDVVRDEAAALGMRRVLVDAERLATAVPAGASIRHEGEFLLDGDVWTISFDGVTIRVPDAKGLHDIRTLIRLPGREVPAVELLDPSVSPEVIAAHRHGADPILDDVARAAYRRRLDELDEAIERALTHDDDADAQRLDAERDDLITELRAATGLGGRSRRLGGETERARKTVTARIRNTLSRIDERHPALAEHLYTSVTTGATCRYQPHEPADWTT